MSGKKVAVIFGVTGMDGSYLSDLLLSKGYEVHGIKRRSSTNTCQRIAHLDNNPDFYVKEGDVTDYASIIQVLTNIPHIDQIYNLAAQSHVGTSFKQPGVTWDITAKGCINILQCMVDLQLFASRFYQASSSEMFGSSFTVDHDGIKADYDLNKELGKDTLKNLVPSARAYQDEQTKFLPQSPYAIAKCAAHMSVQLYREAYGLHASSGILFNHEGSRRGEEFVTKKITSWISDYKKWASSISREKQEGPTSFCYDDKDYIQIVQNNHIVLWKFPKLRLGNIEAKRDWGHAKDYMAAANLIVERDEPGDFVVCTGETHKVSDFLIKAFSKALNDSYENYIVIDPQFYRPSDVEFLLGDCSKAKKELGWSPTISFDQLVEEMVSDK